MGHVRRRRILMKTLCVLLLKISKASTDCGDRLQYRINADAKWGATVGLWLSHIEFQSLSRYVGLVTDTLTLHQNSKLLEHISITRCFNVDKHTGRKRPVTRWKNIYITLRPATADYLRIKDALPRAVNTYRPGEELTQTVNRMTQ